MKSLVWIRIREIAHLSSERQKSHKKGDKMTNLERAKGKMGGKKYAPIKKKGKRCK